MLLRQIYWVLSEALPSSMRVGRMHWFVTAAPKPRAAAAIFDVDNDDDKKGTDDGGRSDALARWCRSRSETRRPGVTVIAWRCDELVTVREDAALLAGDRGGRACRPAKYWLRAFVAFKDSFVVSEATLCCCSVSCNRESPVSIKFMLRAIFLLLKDVGCCDRRTSC
jgi:hypothetical protein